jgi:catalase
MVGTLATRTNGPMAYQVPLNGLPNYYPNSISGSPQPDPVAAGVWPTTSSVGTTGPVGRYETGTSEDNFSQCRTFYQVVLSETERDDLTTNMAGHLHHVKKAAIRQKVLDVLRQVDNSYANAVEQKMRQMQSSPRPETSPPPPAPLNPPRATVVATAAGCPYAVLRHQQSKL